MKRRSFLKLLASTAAVAGAASLPAQARSHQPKFSLRWLGGATMEIEIDGFHILTDPCFGDGDEAFLMGDPNEQFDLSKGPNVKAHKRLTPFPGLEKNAPDLILLSHAHEDHFDQLAQREISRSVLMLCPSHDLQAMQNKGFNAKSIAHGAIFERQTRNGLLTISSIPAIHSLNSSIAAMLGKGNGYWLSHKAGGVERSIYWAGDTFATDEVWGALESRPRPDLFIPHIGDVGRTGALGQLSLNGAQALAFAERLAPGSLFPVHHSTYELYLEPFSALENAYARKKAEYALIAPQPGTRMEI